MCNTKISLKFHADTICANLVTCWPTTDANIRRHLVAIFGTYKRMKSDINVLYIQNFYIIIKAADPSNSDMHTAKSEQGLRKKYISLNLRR